MLKIGNATEGEFRCSLQGPYTVLVYDWRDGSTKSMTISERLFNLMARYQHAHPDEAEFDVLVTRTPAPGYRYKILPTKEVK